MTTCQKSEAIFPVIVVEVNGIRCRVLIDSGAGSSYVSAKLIELLKLKPAQTLVKNIDMLMTPKTSKLEIYNMKNESKPKTQRNESPAEPRSERRRHRRRHLRMPQENTRKFPDILASRGAVHEQTCTVNTCQDPTWWGTPYHGHSA